MQIAKLQRPSLGSWVPFSVGYLKFNVDASVNGNYEVGGIGGILKDHNINHLVIFSKCIGLIDRTGTELAVVLEACLIFETSKWKKNSSLIIEFDCLTIIHWINNFGDVLAVFANDVQK
ncbi:hypothetical protein V6N12_012347 [Hibiscus sabdariffa]|uniref:RNase H type-1 domain-containing protein n=1 Tax=Hibiscus sabdariffa TaxID=183260 RepID=A0ABR2CHV7_9ROSI